MTPELLIRIGVDNTGFASGVEAVAAGLDRIQDKAKEVGARVSSLGRALLPVSAAIGAAAGAMGAVALSAARAGDRIDKASKSAGVTAQTYQELAFALGQVSDVSESEVGTALARLTRNLGEAAGGSKSAADAFAAIGVDVADIASGAVTTEAAFDALVSTLQGAATDGEAASVAAGLLGREMSRIGPILRQSGGELAGLREEANALGIVLSDDAVNAAAAFSDKWSQLNDQIATLKNTLGAELLPVLTDKLIPAIQQNIIPALQKFAGFVGDLIEAFAGLPEPIQTFLGVIVAGLAVGAPAMLALGGLLALMSGPAGIVVGVVAATGAIVALAAAIRDNIGPAVDFIAEKWDAFVSSFKLSSGDGTGGISRGGGAARRASRTGRGKGGEAGAGLVEGLMGPGAETAAAMEAYIDENITGAARRALQIESPSKVFMTIGEQIGQGLADGIESTGELVRAATGVLTGGVTDEAGRAVSDILGSLSTMFEGSKPIAAAQALINTFLGMTEALKLPFPANLAAAAKTLATGMAAVRSIQSASPGAGGASGGAAAAAAASPTPININASFSGDYFTPQQAAGATRQILDAVFSEMRRRGGNFVVTA